MSEKFVPHIKEIANVSGSVSKVEALHASQDMRIQMMNEYIGKGKTGQIMSLKDGKNNDIWIRKQKGNVLKGADAMKENATVKVLKAEYKIDEKDGDPKLYYYCEVDNTDTMNGGSKGKDKGWIYAGYIHMDMPVAPFVPISEPVPEAEEKKEKPNQFKFDDYANMPLGELMASNEITVQGITSGKQISIIGGEYSINNGPWASTPSAVINGDRVQVRHKTSTKYNTPTDTTLTIGGVSDTFTTITESEKQDEKPVEVPVDKKPIPAKNEGFPLKETNIGPDVYTSEIGNQRFWLIGPDDKPMTKTQVETAYAKTVEKQEEELGARLNTPQCLQGQMLLEVYDVWSNKARSLNNEDIDMASMDALANNLAASMANNIMPLENVTKEMEDLMRAMSRVENKQADIIDSDDFSSIELILAGYTNPDEKDATRRAVFEQMRTGIFGDDGDSERVKNAMIEKVLQNPPKKPEFQWLIETINSEKTNTDLLLGRKSEVIKALEAMGFRGAEGVMEDIVEQLEEIGKQRDMIRDAVRSDLEAKMPDFDISKKEHRDLLETTTDAAVINAKKSFIQSAWMEFMIDTRPDFRNDPNIDFIGGVVGEKSGWDMDLSDKNWAHVQEIAIQVGITAALVAIPMAGGIAAAAWVARGGAALARAGWVARAGLATRNAEGVMQAGRLLKGATLIGEGTLFHTTFGALGELQGLAAGKEWSPVQKGYWEVKEFVKSIAILGVMKGIGKGMEHARNVKLGNIPNPEGLIKSALINVGNIAGKTPLLSQTLAMVATENIYEQIIGDKDLSTLTLEEFLEEFAQALVMGAMAKHIGARIEKIGPKIPGDKKTVKEKPAETQTEVKEIKVEVMPKSTETLLLKNEFGQEGSYLKLMENSTHPEIVRVKLEKTLQGWDTRTLEKYVDVVKGDIARLEKITKSKNLQPGTKETKDTFATPEQKAKALNEIQRHQEKLVIARKAITERQAANGVTKEKMPLISAQERMMHVKPGESVIFRRTDGKRLKILVESNNNGVLQGTPMKDGKAIGPKSQYEVTEGGVKITGKDGTSYSEKLSNITEMEVQYAALPQNSQNPEVISINNQRALNAQRNIDQSNARIVNGRPKLMEKSNHPEVVSERIRVENMLSARKMLIDNGKPGSTIKVEQNDGATMEIKVRKNENGIIEGTAKSTEANGSVNKEVDVKIQIQETGDLLITTEAGIMNVPPAQIGVISIKPASHE